MGDAYPISSVDQPVSGGEGGTRVEHIRDESGLNEIEKAHFARTTCESWASELRRDMLGVLRDGIATKAVVKAFDVAEGLAKSEKERIVANAGRLYASVAKLAVELITSSEKVAARSDGAAQPVKADIYRDGAMLAGLMEATMRGVPPPGDVLPPSWTTFKFCAEQVKLLNCIARWVYAMCGRRSGKTEISLRRLVTKLPERKPWPDPRYFFGAPTNDQAIRIAWDRLIALIPPQWIKGIHVKDQYIESIFGSRIYIIGLDAPHRIQGPPWDWGVLDESSHLKESAFNIDAANAIGDRNGGIWRIGVPDRRGIGYLDYTKKFAAAMAGELPNSEAFTWFSDEVLPEEIITDAKKRLTDADFREQFQAAIIPASGGIFYAFSLSGNTRRVTYERNKRIVVGLDFNVDPMTGTLAHRGANLYEVFDAFSLPNSNTESMLNWLWNKYGPHHMGGWDFVPDASSRARQASAKFSSLAIIANDERFKNAPGGRNIYCDDSNPPVESRFASMNAMFCNAAGERRCFIDPTLTVLTDALLARHRKPGSNEPENDGSEHITDALGYPLHKFFPLTLEFDMPPPKVQSTPATSATIATAPLLGRSPTANAKDRDDGKVR